MKINDNLSMPSISPAPKKEENPALRGAARQFESLFVNQMVSAMRKTIVKQGLVPESQGERVYQSMLDSEYASKMAESDQLGLSKLIYEHLLRTQGSR